MDYFKIYSFDKKKRFGIPLDGGYVAADVGNPYDCYISAGVSYEESFTKEFIECYGMNDHQCFAYDGTVPAYPYDYTTNINFTHKNIGSTCDNKTTNLKQLIQRYNNIFLKMDIEGGEYSWISCLTEDDLQRFSQIIIEYHGINDDSWGETLENKKKCFEKLTKTHYAVHAHGNTNGGRTHNVPDVLEVTYVRKNYILNPTLNTTPLPIVGLDFKNNTALDYDYNLNFYPFTSS